MDRIVTKCLFGVLAAVALAVAASPADAQTTYYACRIPPVNAIYMVDAATACLNASHVKFSWEEGGTIADGSITTTMLADGAVTAAKLDPGITLGIGAGAVGTVELADAAVTGAKIEAGAVGNGHLAADAVESDIILDGTIATADLADGSVTSAKLGANAVTTANIVNGTIATVDIANGAVTAAKLGVALPTVVSADVGTQGVPASAGNMASLVLNAPGAGFALVTASGMIQASRAAGATTSAYLGVSSTSATLVSGSYTRLYMSSTVAAGTYEIPYSVQGLFPVSQGANTLYLVGQGAATTYFNRMTVTFIGQ